jgi:hypothetical protein
MKPTYFAASSILYLVLICWYFGFLNFDENINFNFVILFLRESFLYFPFVIISIMYGCVMGMIFLPPIKILIFDEDKIEKYEEELSLLKLLLENEKEKSKSLSLVVSNYKEESFFAEKKEKKKNDESVNNAFNILLTSQKDEEQKRKDIITKKNCIIESTRYQRDRYKSKYEMLDEENKNLKEELKKHLSQ